MSPQPLLQTAPAPATPIVIGALHAGPRPSERADVEARIFGMLPLVRHVVADVANSAPRYLDREDLISAGMLGLTQAAHTYDHRLGASFQAFARVRIRGAVLDELRGRDPLSRGARRRANQVNAATVAMQETLGRTPTDTETASRLGVEVAVVRQARDDTSRATELERSVGHLEGSEVAERAEGADGGPLADLLDAELRGYLIDAVAALPDRLRAIVVAHFFDRREMQDIAAELGVTASRISQLCSQAIALLRDGLNSQLDPHRVDDLHVTTGRVGRCKHAYYQLIADASTVGSRLDRGRATSEWVVAA